MGAFGATLSVRVPGHDDIHLASGVDDRDPDTPMPTDGTFLAISITKTFVAAIALQLVDEGRLSLDQPVEAWIPKLPNADRITLAMLRGHTSGLGDMGPRPGDTRRPDPIVHARGGARRRPSLHHRTGGRASVSRRPTLVTRRWG